MGQLAVTPEDAKLWADRKRTILSYIDQERQRCLGLVMAIENDKNFLLWCITQSYTDVEIGRARELYDQYAEHVATANIPAESVAIDDIEDLM